VAGRVPGAWSGGGLGGRWAMHAGAVGNWGNRWVGFYLYRISPSQGSAVLVLLGLVERAKLESGVDVRIGFSAWYQPQPPSSVSQSQR
jgi:hypothetical protein